jgi:hypothetical protein
MNLALAQGLAALISVAVYAVIAIFYLIPWMKARNLAAAFTPLLWINVFRYMALQGYSAQAAGFPVSDAQEMRVAVGDMIGAAIALLAIIAFHYRSRLAIPMAWLLVFETAYDFVNNIVHGAGEHLSGLTNGVGWMVVGFYVPMVAVSAVVMATQLYARRHETLALLRSEQSAPAKILRERA